MNATPVKLSATDEKACYSPADNGNCSGKLSKNSGEDDRANLQDTVNMVNNKKQSTNSEESVTQDVKTLNTEQTRVFDNDLKTDCRKMTENKTLNLVDDKVGSIQTVSEESNSNSTQRTETEIHSRQQSVGVMNHHGIISFPTQEMALKKNNDNKVHEEEHEPLDTAHNDGLSKENQLKIEQLTQRLKETESKLKTEVARVKKQFQLQMGELEMSLDSANKQNIDLQKTTKKQNLQMTELKSHYEDIHQKLQQTVDQLELCQHRCQTLQAELDETRASLDSAQRFKRTAQQSLEEAQSVINELTTVNTRLTSDKAKVENELSGLQAGYDVLQKELRANEERATRAETDLRLTKDRLAQEQDRFLKMDSIKNALEMEVRNLQNRIEEVESSTLAGSKRVIAKLETRIRDLETDYEEEKRRNAETQKIIRKKEHRLKEQLLKTEEDHNTILNLKDCVENLSEKCKIYKRQLAEKEGMAQQNQARVRRFQRELESAEDRADLAEGNLSLIRIKHKTLIPPNQESGSILHG